MLSKSFDTVDWDILGCALGLPGLVSSRSISLSIEMFAFVLKLAAGFGVSWTRDGCIPGLPSEYDLSS